MTLSTSTQQFSIILSRALDRIAFLQSKSKMILYDEIGYAMGRSGGSAIQYWLYHQKIPAKLSELELLVQLIYERKGWQNWQEIQDFLSSAGHPNAELIAKTYINTPQNEFEEQELPVSPFVVGPPIFEPKKFFGRNKEVSRIFMALQGPVLQHVAVIGKPRSGKTSLLHYLRKITQTPSDQLRPNQKSSWLAMSDRFQWVFVDFQDPRMGTQEGFFRYLIKHLNFVQPVENSLSVFIDTLTKRIHSPTIIMLDEIQAAFMIPELDQQFWWALRSLCTNLTEGKLSFIVTSQRHLSELVLDDGKPSPFLNVFGHVLHLGAFTAAEADVFLDHAPIDFSEDEKIWIVETSKRWPALMQILCNLRYEAELDPDLEDWRSAAIERLRPYKALLD